MCSINITKNGKTIAVIKAVKIFAENGIAEYEVQKQVYAMGRVAAVIKYGTIKIDAELKGKELELEIIRFVKGQ